MILSKLYETLDMALESNKLAGKAILDVYRELDEFNDVNDGTLISLEAYLGRLSLFEDFRLTDEGKNFYEQIEDIDKKYTNSFSVNNIFTDSKK
ncbi:hypothetical protein [Companilactobacillus nodensis]|uniref:hypothetical protein n=1 Tax=Companilactobacillus nodensis TaxID=460870 RepID=UPI00077B86A3|nr:hypothetical protein [Companilactobacillus nodensis]